MNSMYEVTITKIENGDRENAKVVDTMTFIYIGVFDGFHTYEVHMNGEVFNVTRYVDDIWEIVAEAISGRLYEYEDTTTESIFDDKLDAEIKAIIRRDLFED